MVKVFCTEMADRIAGWALDIFGDEGYLKKISGGNVPARRSAVSHLRGHQRNSAHCDFPETC